jgi:hypothetical protein
MKYNTPKTAQILSAFLTVVGIILLIISSFVISSFLSIVGISLVFWGVILIYIAPSKYVPLSVFNAADAGAINIERILNEFNLKESGIYLPPVNLKDVNSSLVFLPNCPNAPFPSIEETTDLLLLKEKNGVLLTPPGLSLSRLFEQALGISFCKVNLEYVQRSLPKLLIEKMELVEDITMDVGGALVIVNINGNVLNQICQQTNYYPRTHRQIGCLLSSAIACILAKATGLPVKIQRETVNIETKTTTIEYNVGGL